MTKEKLDMIIGKGLEDGTISSLDSHVMYSCFLFTKSKLKSNKAELKKKFGTIFFEGMEEE
jgi:hypothetical protein